jgi:6-phosphofructokinase 1
MRIAVLTGGGDVPGLNVAIKRIVELAEDRGIEVYGIRRGWAGLLNYNPDDPASFDTWVEPLDKLKVRTIDRTGGTFLHTSRTNPTRINRKITPDFLMDQAPAEGETKDFTPHVIKVLESLGIDALMPIGGDDTLGYGSRLYEAGFGNMIGLPKTMDNDIPGTDYCIGFSTAMTRCVDFIRNLRSATGSHERIAMIEVFGRHSGATALISGYLSSADRVLIAEVPFDVERLAELVMKDRAENPSNYAMVVISEGAKYVGGEVIERMQQVDSFGHGKLGGIGQEVGSMLTEITGVKMINQTIAYLMRSGTPDALDQMVARNYASMAMKLLDEKKFGNMVALRDGVYTYVPITVLKEGSRSVEVDKFYDKENYVPTIDEVGGLPMFLR